MATKDQIAATLTEQEIAELETLMVEFNMPNPRQSAIEVLVNNKFRVAQKNKN